jgi:hypothetical protein
VKGQATGSLAVFTRQEPAGNSETSFSQIHSPPTPRLRIHFQSRRTRATSTWRPARRPPSGAAATTSRVASRPDSAKPVERRRTPA